MSKDLDRAIRYEEMIKQLIEVIDEFSNHYLNVTDDYTRVSHLNHTLEKITEGEF